MLNQRKAILLKRLEIDVGKGLDLLSIEIYQQFAQIVATLFDRAGALLPGFEVGEELVDRPEQV